VANQGCTRRHTATATESPGEHELNRTARPGTTRRTTARRRRPRAVLLGEPQLRGETHRAHVGGLDGEHHRLAGKRAAEPAECRSGASAFPARRSYLVVTGRRREHRGVPGLRDLHRRVRGQARRVGAGRGERDRLPALHVQFRGTHFSLPTFRATYPKIAAGTPPGSGLRGAHLRGHAAGQRRWMCPQLLVLRRPSPREPPVPVAYVLAQPGPLDTKLSTGHRRVRAAITVPLRVFWVYEHDGLLTGTVS
jgi:hypothetical protein